MYAYAELKKQLESVDEFRFIFTSPTFVEERAEKQKREFYIPRLSRENSLDAPFASQYIQLFDTLWNDKEKMQDVTETIIENISTAYNENSPEFIYFVTLYHVFSEFLEDISEDVLPNEATNAFRHAGQQPICRPAKSACYATLFDPTNVKKITSAQFQEKSQNFFSVVMRYIVPMDFWKNPDWAIAFKEGTVKHIYFVTETKGSMSSMQLRDIEKAKIHCAREHFKAISSGSVVYDVVDNYDSLLKLVTR